MVDAEQATGRRLVQGGWMRRFDPDYQDVYAALRSGRVGEPVLISQRHCDPLSVIKFDERELITSSASHDIDIFRWLCGEDIVEVTAITKISQDGSAVIVVLTLASQSGVLGVMELCPGPGLSYDIGASAGALTLADSTSADDSAAQPSAEAWMARFARAYRFQNAASHAVGAARGLSVARYRRRGRSPIDLR